MYLDSVEIPSFADLFFILVFEIARVVRPLDVPVLDTVKTI